MAEAVVGGMADMVGIVHRGIGAAIYVRHPSNRKMTYLSIRNRPISGRATDNLPAAAVVKADMVAEMGILDKIDQIINKGI